MLQQRHARPGAGRYVPGDNEDYDYALTAIPASGLANATGALAELRWVYSLGILERCHLVSITSLTRLCRWLDACVVMANPPNALAFSAAPPLAQFPVGANILDAH